MAVAYCGNDFCGPQKGSIDVTCHDLNKEAGKWIMYQRPSGTCYCICSCLGEGTEITLGDGNTRAVQYIRVNQDKILAAGLDLKFHDVLVTQQSFAPRAKTANTIFLSYHVEGRQLASVVTQSHPFLLYDSRKIVGAALLSPSDRLVDRNGKPVTIESIRWGTYEGSFWEIATSLTQPDANLSDHLIVAGGVVIGDFAVETFINYPTSDAVPFGDAIRLDGPVVGSREWIAAYGVPTVSADEVASIDVNGNRFIPASAQRIHVPAHASDFFPEWQADWFLAVAPKRPYNDPYALELCEWLLDRVFRPVYPEVEFLFNWYSEEVNSHSWVDNGRKYVYLSGGLARMEAMDYDSVALAIAHELGHLYGKPDGSPSGVTCEGEADFYGAAVGLRNVWFGEYYFKGTRQAIDQIKQVYGYLTAPGEQGKRYEANTARTDKQGRRYPSNECRIETWEAGMSSPKKPACADCAPANP